VSSALARFDARALGSVWIMIRLVLAVLIMMRPEAIHVPALAAAVAMVIWHYVQARRLSPV
jgi:hypothetical protein